ncbi:hypothetical protein DFQ27_008828, partial [Actinomortierella ambigua]
PPLASVLYSALNTLIEQSGLADMTVSSILTTEGITLDPSVRAEPKAAAPTGRPGGQTLMSMDLKAGRLAVLVLGQFAQLIQRLATRDVGQVVGTSNEPRDYSRFPHSSSWLRALWEALWEPLQLGTVERAQRQVAAAEGAGFVASLTCLLETLRSLPLPLPAVNWFPLLNQLVALEPRLLVATVRFASRHAMTSTSLMEYLVLVLANFKTVMVGHGDVVVVRADLEQAARELLVGEEGLGRLLALAGLPWLDHRSSGGKDGTARQGRPKDRVAAELAKVRGLDTFAKRVHLPISRAFELVESAIRLLFPTHKSGSESAANMEDREVLQLILLDTLQHHLPKPRALTAGSGGSVVKTSMGKTAAEESLAAVSGGGGSSSTTLVHDLRALLTQVYYQFKVIDDHVVSSERVLRRLANLSFMSISHLDAMPCSSSSGSTAEAVATMTMVEEAKHILKDAIGLASLYRAGLLTASQENRMITVAQKAVVLLSHDHLEDSEKATVQELVEMAFSVLLYSMRDGPCSTSSPSSSSISINNNRVVWLQRILDLLILMADATPKLMLGIRWLLAGAALLWWDRQELALTVGRPVGQDVGSTDSNTMTLSWLQSSSGGSKHDADAELLEMLEGDDDGDDDDDYGFGYGGGADGGDDGYDPEDENPMADSRFDEWHACYLEHSWDVQEAATTTTTTASDLSAQLDRTVLVLPDVVLYLAGPMSVVTWSAEHPASQITKRFLQLAQEQTVQPRERLFFIRLLRRLEDLVPDASKWVLLATSA